jgi:predicted outer membrane repeat protein
MDMRFKGFSILPVCFAVLTLCPGALPVGGAVIHVPADQPTIQQGIDAADHGDTVLVADGVYSGPGNIELDPLGKGIHIRSVKGAEGCTIDCRGEGRAFSLQSCESCFTVIEGLTIRNGSATEGGGIYGFWSSPTIIGCRFIDCQALDAGGAIHGHFFSPRIVDCVFSGNSALHGGALYLFNDSDPRVERCTFTGNRAEVCGGGICCKTGAGPVITDCLFEHNYALLGGGLNSDHFASPFIESCTFQLNRAWNGGGAFLGPNSDQVLLDAVFTGNKADWCGGAVHGCHADALLVNGLLTGNQALGHGGGVYGSHFTAKVQLCTLTGNSAVGGGGAVASSRSQLILIDSILWGCGPEPVLHLDGPPPSITHCDVEGGWDGAGNIDADPLFTEGPDGDCCLSHVAAGDPGDSPCLDAGSCPAAEVCLPTPDDTGCGDLQLASTGRDWCVDQGMVDLGYHRRACTVEADIRCSPLVGVLPLTLEYTITMGNRCRDERRIAAAIELVTAAGQRYANWRQGWADLLPGRSLDARWSLELPDLSTLEGMNRFDLVARDVTPAPFNQPPCRPSGHAARAGCTVMGLASP